MHNHPRRDSNYQSSDLVDWHSEHVDLQGSPVYRICMRELAHYSARALSTRLPRWLRENGDREPEYSTGVSTAAKLHLALPHDE